MSKFALNQTDAEFLCNVFALGQLHEVKEFPAGLINTSVLCITNKGKYVLRIYNHKNAEQVAFEVDVLRKAANYGLSVPYPLPTTSGENIVRYKGKYCLAYPYLPGESPADLSLGHVEQIGNFLGKFHKCVEGFKPSGVREPLNVEDFRNNLQEYAAVSLSSDLPEIKTQVAWLSDKIKTISLPPSLPRGPIHIDVKPENLLFTGQKLTGVLDFDNGFVGPFVVDIGKTLMWCCFENGQLQLPKAKALLLHYSKHRPLLEQERDCLFEAIEFSFVSHVFRDFYLYSKGIIPRDYVMDTVYPLLSTAKQLERSRKDVERLVGVV